MYRPPGVKTSPKLSVPEQMKAWVLGIPDELFLREKPVPVPGSRGSSGPHRRRCDLRNRP